MCVVHFMGSVIWLELFANSAFYTLESFYIHHFAGALK